MAIMSVVANVSALLHSSFLHYFGAASMSSKVIRLNWVHFKAMSLVTPSKKDMAYGVKHWDSLLNTFFVNGLKAIRSFIYLISSRICQTPTPVSYILPSLSFTLSISSSIVYCDGSRRDFCLVVDTVAALSYQSSYIFSVFCSKLPMLQHFSRILANIKEENAYSAEFFAISTMLHSLTINFKLSRLQLEYLLFFWYDKLTFLCRVL